MSKQTAMQIAIEKIKAEIEYINDDRSVRVGLRVALAIIEETLPVEREQIEDAFKAGELYGDKVWNTKENPYPDFKSYFTNTYKNTNDE